MSVATLTYSVEEKEPISGYVLINDKKMNLGSRRRGLKQVAVRCTVRAINLNVSTLGFYNGAKKYL